MNAINSAEFIVEALGVTSLAALSYGSTNFDNLVILSAYTAKPGFRAHLVRLTFLLVCLAVLLISFLLAKAADSSISAGQVRYLGVIPIVLGGYQLLMLLAGRASGDEAAAEAPAAMGLAAYFGFAVVLLANSSDSIGVMTPLFADLRPSLVLVIFVAATIMAMLMTGLAHILASHPVAKAYLEKAAKWALPFLLIGIGAMILADSPADVFMAQN